jgi:hypothetical protein
MIYMIAIGNCVVCGNLFSFNPEKVPSIRINGEKEPICRSCMERVNALKREKGIPEFEIPKDAYAPEPEC